MTDHHPQYQAQLAHLLTLAATPGWREYVKGRLDELEADHSGAWTGIRADLNAAIQQRKQEQQ